MIAEIISIGAELLLGETLDSNAVFLSEELRDLGFPLYYRITVGDNLLRISEVIRLALKRSDLVITTGGLGPTDGDITRDGIAHALGEEITIDPKLLDEIERIFLSHGRQMSPKNRKQAGLIPSAKPLVNSVGTAPGWLIDKDGKRIVALPGPPHEMKIMWTDRVQPILSRSQKGFYAVTLHTLGIGESNLADLLGSLTDVNNPSVATYARPHGIDIRIAASAPARMEAVQMVEPVLATVTQSASRFIYGREAETLPSVIEGILREKNQTIGAVEGFSSGWIGVTLNEFFPVRAFFKGGYTSGVEPISHGCGGGAPAPRWRTSGGPNPFQISTSSTNMLESAEKFRALIKTDWVVGCSDFEGEVFPDGKCSGKVTVVVTGKDVRVTENFNWPGEINHLRRRVAYMALFLLLRALRGERD